jgi:hypothetical protein
MPWRDQTLIAIAREVLVTSGTCSPSGQRNTNSPEDALVALLGYMSMLAVRLSGRWLRVSAARKVELCAPGGG